MSLVGNQNGPVTSKQRFLKAVNHQEADRVPLCMDAEREVYQTLFKYLKCESKEEVFDCLGIDEWMLDPDVTDPRIKVIDRDSTLSQWGYTKKLEYTEIGSYEMICNEPLKQAEPELSTIKDYDWPDPECLFFTKWPARMQTRGDKAFIGHFTHGPYFNCTYLRGQEQYLIDLALNPDFAEALLNRVEQYIQTGLDRLLSQAGANLDIFYIADDFCQQTGPLFNPDIWRKLIKPYLKRMADKVHKAGKKFMLHVCGGVRVYIPDLIEVGVDILEPIQTTAAGMELEGLKRDFGKDLTFYGSMDTHVLLPKGTPVQVSDGVKRTLDIMAPGGGFILGPAHTYIQPDTPVENIVAMYKTAREYGVY